MEHTTVTPRSELYTHTHTHAYASFVLGSLVSQFLFHPAGACCLFRFSLSQKGASGSALITNNGTHDIYALHASSSSIKGVTFPVFETLPSLAKANKAIWTQVFFQYVLDQSTLEAADLGASRGENTSHQAVWLADQLTDGSTVLLGGQETIGTAQSSSANCPFLALGLWTDLPMTIPPERAPMSFTIMCRRA